MELLKELWDNPWITPLFLVAVGWVRYSSGIKKGVTTAKKPFVAAPQDRRDVPPDDNFGDETAPAHYVRGEVK